MTSFNNPRAPSSEHIGRPSDSLATELNFKGLILSITFSKLLIGYVEFVVKILEVVVSINTTFASILRGAR